MDKEQFEIPPTPSEYTVLLSKDEQRRVLALARDLSLQQPPVAQTYFPPAESNVSQDIFVTSRALAGLIEPVDVVLGKDPMERRTNAFFSGIMVGYCIGKLAFPSVTKIQNTVRLEYNSAQDQLDGLSEEEIVHARHDVAQYIRANAGFGLSRVDCAEQLAERSAEILVPSDVDLQIDHQYGIGLGIYIYYNADKLRRADDMRRMEYDIAAISLNPAGWNEIEAYLQSGNF